jgi:acyl carrier protein
MSSELAALEGFIRKETGHDGDIPFDIDLLDARILDSFNIVTLAMFIQENFAVELDAEDLVRENLAKMSSMIALIHRKQNEAQGARTGSR